MLKNYSNISLSVVLFLSVTSLNAQTNAIKGEKLEPLETAILEFRSWSALRQAKE